MRLKWLKHPRLLIALGLLGYGGPEPSTAQETLSLSPDPILTLDPPEGHELFQIESIVLTRGGLVVASRGSNEVMWFSLDGDFLGSVGRAGQGPGEFRWLSSAELCGDSIYVWDAGTDRVSVLKNREFKRSFQLPALEGRVPQRVRCSEAGVLALYRISGAQPETPLGRYRPTMVLHEFTQEGEHVSRLGEFPGDERYRHATTDGPSVFGKVTILAKADEGFAVGTGDKGIFSVFDSGARELRTLNLGVPPEPVLEADLREHQAAGLRMVESLGPGVVAARRKNQEEYDYPQFYPPYGDAFTDDAGRIWVQRYKRVRDETERWVRFGDDGHPQFMALPADFELMNVRGDLVVGVWRDQLDVEHVRIYRLVAGS